MTTNKNSLKGIKAREKKQKEAEEKALCEAYAIGKLGSEQNLVKLCNEKKGLWYLPVFDDDGNVEKMLILRPVDRLTLSMASSKSDDGLYVFLESAMRDCVIEEYSDMDIFEIEDMFIAAALAFQKMMEGRRVSILKR